MYSVMYMKYAVSIIFTELTPGCLQNYIDRCALGVLTVYTSGNKASQLIGKGRKLDSS